MLSLVVPDPFSPLNGVLEVTDSPHQGSISPVGEGFFLASYCPGDRLLLKASILELPIGLNHAERQIRRIRELVCRLAGLDLKGLDR